MLSKEEAQQKISRLVEKYDRITSSGSESSFNEPNTKKDLIEPLFEALGWDVRNEFTEDEMKMEEKVSKGRVDYSFRINSIIKFFLEAKSLKIDIEDSNPIRQAIDYAYHKGTRWVVLTNFKKIIVFNAEWKIKNIMDSKFLTLNCSDFIKDFDDLWLLSREGMVNGLLDKRAEKYSKIPLKKPIDQQLLDDFISWRNNLSTDIQNRNKEKKLEKGQIDEAVQRILDRLIFIRKCEDSELEEKKLKEIVHNWNIESKRRLLDSLIDVFRYYDKNYDSKIFEKHFCENLEISDQIIEDIIYGLYYTKDKSISYKFDDIDADILGNIYEQYLSHILRSTSEGVKLSERQAHRKDQGIYYTPPFVVNYIVRNTLGELIKNKKVNLENIRVLDPACGSGSFLIKAFDLLNDYYSKHDRNYSQTHLDKEVGVPFTTKSKILQNNIFGVDLDNQAVEIAQLNLLLSIAERGHRLPLLQHNIKNGNSLIDDEKTSKHYFRWNHEFQDINGKFDIVIGNPPYGAELSSSEKSYIKENFKGLKSGDTAEYFVKKSIDLLKDDGILGLILPKTIAFYESWKGIRDFIFKNCTILNVADVGIAFFDVNLEEIIIILRKSKPKQNYAISVSRFSDLKRAKKEKTVVETKLVDSSIMVNNSIIIFSPLKPEEQRIIKKINENSIKFSELVENAFRGIYIPDAKKKLLRRGDIKFVEKVPWVKRYNITKSTEININEDFIDKGKIRKIMTERLLFKVLRGNRLVVLYDDGKLLTTEKLVNVTLKKNADYNYKFLLGLFNSKLASFHIQKTLFSDTTETARVMDYPYVSLLPVPIVSKKDQEPIAALADKILDLNKQLKTHPNEREKIAEEIKKLDAELDDKVYKIYGISEEEKKVIKNNFGGI